MFNATAESVNYILSFFEKSRNTFLQYLPCKKNFVNHIENLPQHLSKKFIGDNSSITNIAIRNWDLSIIGIAQGSFENINYRYRFSMKKFIVPITGNW